MVDHVWAKALGVVAFLLAILAIADYEGFIGNSQLGGYDFTALGVLVFLVAIAAFIVYAVEE